MKNVKCRRCGSVFTVQGSLGQLCPNCIRNEEETYSKVRSFVKDNPGVSVQEVSEILSVPRTKIMNYIKEERLEVTGDSKTFLTCKNCGKSISTGVFCPDCKRVFADSPKTTDSTPQNVKLSYNKQPNTTADFIAGHELFNNHNHKN